MFVGQDKHWRIKIVISIFRAVAVVRRIGAQPGRTSAAKPRGTSVGLKPLVVHLRHSQNQGQTRPKSHREKRAFESMCSRATRGYGCLSTREECFELSLGNQTPSRNSLEQSFTHHPISATRQSTMQQLRQSEPWNMIARLHDSSSSSSCTKTQRP
jgi:hypothetical protein